MCVCVFFLLFNILMALELSWPVPVRMPLDWCRLVVVSKTKTATTTAISLSLSFSLTHSHRRGNITNTVNTPNINALSPPLLRPSLLFVAQIFFNSEHLGGNDDLQKLHEEGKLEGLVANVRAEAPGMMKPTWYHPWY